MFGQMVQVRNRRQPKIQRLSLTIRYISRDRILIVFILLMLIGIALFQISSLTPIRELAKIQTGSGSFTAYEGINRTVYFSNIGGDQSVVYVMAPSGTMYHYWIYTYAYLRNFAGVHYVQTLISQGTVSGNLTYYLPLSYKYADLNFFINISIANTAEAPMSVNAFSEFYYVQPFQFPEEVAGLSLIIASIVGIAVSITRLVNRFA